jgi:hypothetical protein
MPNSSPNQGPNRPAFKNQDPVQGNHSPTPLHQGEILSPMQDAPIGLAKDAPIAAVIPTADEIAQYGAQATAFLDTQRISLSELKIALRSAWELRDRLEGRSSGGALSTIETRVGWAAQACENQFALTKEIQGLYASEPKRVVRTIVADFIQRLDARGVVISAPHAASLVTAALEQTRLMVVFAGRALRSEDHAQSAIAGIQERSFVGKSSAVGPSEKTGDARQAAFEQRQAEKAAASAAKRSALKTGGAIPVSGAAPKTNHDDEKTALVAATAAQHRAQFDTARPTEEQRATLKLRELKELSKLLAARVKGGESGASPDEIEKTRIEAVNNFAHRMKDWLALEVQLGSALGLERLSLDEFPFCVASLGRRHEGVQRMQAELKELQRSNTEVLTRIGKAVLALSTQEQQAFSPGEIERLRSLVTPEEPREIYGIATD